MFATRIEIAPAVLRELNGGQFVMEDCQGKPEITGIVREISINPTDVIILVDDAKIRDTETREFSPTEYSPHRVAVNRAGFRLTAPESATRSVRFVNLTPNVGGDITITYNQQDLKGLSVPITS